MLKEIYGHSAKARRPSIVMLNYLIPGSQLFVATLDYETGQDSGMLALADNLETVFANF